MALLINTILQFLFGIVILRDKSVKTLKFERNEFRKGHLDFEFIKSFGKGNEAKVLDYLLISEAQNRQDVLALCCSNFKKNGFFVEFGAADGLNISNTKLLEQKFGWSGILVEPSRQWHQSLKKNRDANIDFRVVHSRTGEMLEFFDTPDPLYSTLRQHRSNDGHAYRRKSGVSYLVESISLCDLLATYNAPETIDFLSIDTEGSEYEILKNFPFEQFKFTAVCCEHNYGENRECIVDLFERNGYSRIGVELSGPDDWFVPKDLLL